MAARVLTVIGLSAALFFFGHGVLRYSVEPLLYIDSLSGRWGESAYLAMQMGGVHGFAQGGIVAFSTWAVGASIIGLGRRSLPRAVCFLGILPGIRLLVLLGPSGLLPEGLWVVFIASIVGSMLWPLALGAWLLLGRPRREPAPVPAPA